jgi:hypothetical protein
MLKFTLLIYYAIFTEIIFPFKLYRKRKEIKTNLYRILPLGGDKG